MNEPLRTFIAVAVPCPAALRPVVRSLGEMGNAVRPVATDSMHVTLRFLGDTPGDRVGEILDAIRESAADVPPFEIDFTGLGAFPDQKRPGVVWAGVKRGESLNAIVTRLNDPLHGLGYPQERRPFAPHLTLARVRKKPPQSLDDLFDRHAETPFGTVAVREITLYQSELTPVGPHYHALSQVQLISPR